MAQPKGTDVNPRLILPGHRINPKTTGYDSELVRSVSVVLHLANGFDEVYEDGEMVKVLPNATLPDPLPDNLQPVPEPEGE